ncbi:hypothetical protein G6F65_016658 [Rhizopus arrhizus]|nr:hypothetical protein G6F65_016658 [Rhizopus arrhizus]
MVNVGNGLRGMRERLQQCGGQLQVETRPGEGFRLRATVPATVLVAALTKVPEGGIRSLLALDDGIEVVAEAGDGRQAVELIPQMRPDVVLMDMRMPVMSGLEALQVLSRQEQLPPTIILTTFDDDQLVLAGLKAGAKGYLLKDVTLAQLVGAIRTVADGGSLVQPAVTQRLLSGLEHMRNEFVSLDRPDPLTDRETEILRLMASGFSNKEIANSLGVAEGTIKNHVSNILSKLGVRDRTRAVLKAFELQLV